MTNSYFANHFAAANIILAKTQISKIIRIVGLPGKIFETSLRVSLPLIENTLISLARSVLIPLGLIINH